MATATHNHLAASTCATLVILTAVLMILLQARSVAVIHQGAHDTRVAWCNLPTAVTGRCPAHTCVGIDVAEGSVDAGSLQLMLTAVTCAYTVKTAVWSQPLLMP